MPQGKRLLLLPCHPKLDVRDEAPCFVLDEFDVEVRDGIDLGDGQFEHIALEEAVFLLK